MASTSGGTLALSSVHSACAAAKISSLSAFALAIVSLSAVTADATEGCAVSTSLYLLLPKPRLSVAIDSSRPLRSSGAYFSASARISASADSTWAMAFSAGSLWFAQAASARAVAVSATNIFAIRIGISSISVGLDLVRGLKQREYVPQGLPLLSDGADVRACHTTRIAVHQVQSSRVLERERPGFVVAIGLGSLHAEIHAPPGVVRRGDVHDRITLFTEVLEFVRIRVPARVVRVYPTFDLAVEHHFVGDHEAYSGFERPARQLWIGNIDLRARDGGGA